MRLPGCNHDRATTVLAHYRLAGYAGAGQKPPDDFAFGAWACSHCHDVVDGRKPLPDHDRAIIRLAHAEGCLRTMAEVRKLKIAGEI